MSKPDWEDAPMFANWLAQDRCCRWTWYEAEPEPDIEIGIWLAMGGDFELVDRLEDLSTHKGWLSTLERRP